MDPRRCAALGKGIAVRTTIAHGFLSLSLLTWFLERTLVIEGGTMGLNYGSTASASYARRGRRRAQGRFTLVELHPHLGRSCIGMRR